MLQYPCCATTRERIVSPPQRCGAVSRYIPFLWASVSKGLAKCLFTLLPRRRSSPAHSASFLASHSIHARAARTHFLFEVNHVEVYNNIKFPFTRFAGSALFLRQKTHSLARRAFVYLSYVTSTATLCTECVWFFFSFSFLVRLIISQLSLPITPLHFNDSSARRWWDGTRRYIIFVVVTCDTWKVTPSTAAAQWVSFLDQPRRLIEFRFQIQASTAFIKFLIPRNNIGNIVLQFIFNSVVCISYWSRFLIHKPLRMYRAGSQSLYNNKFIIVMHPDPYICPHRRLLQT